MWKIFLSVKMGFADLKSQTRVIEMRSCMLPEKLHTLQKYNWASATAIRNL